MGCELGVALRFTSTDHGRTFGTFLAQGGGEGRGAPSRVSAVAAPGARGATDYTGADDRPSSRRLRKRISSSRVLSRAREPASSAAALEGLSEGATITGDEAERIGCGCREEERVTTRRSYILEMG